MNLPRRWQIRSHDLHPESYLPLLLVLLAQERDALLRGALVSLDEATSRVRILPLPR